MNIQIIGTSHIARQSINEIKKAIEEYKPDIVAVELDLRRASALFQKEKSKISIREVLSIGVKGYLFIKMGQFVQQKLGRIVGVAPGSEMKTAIELARKNKIYVSYIDQPIEVTLRNFSKNLTWKEKGRFIADMLKGLIFPKQQMKEIGLDQFDLNKVPKKDVVEKMIKHIKLRYPNVYKTFIEDRNKYMVKNLVKLLRENQDKKILAVVGAGHKEGMEKLLLKVDVV